ncbi:MAG TPA: V-type ATP synthase subunit E [Methanocella sp.]|uniref:V-type ATP synthase subunit E n=1 Tax=Methanocella sp. TaxID=2052833 RepID=UPI002C0243DD|nr:V-type ATP synthase subunit E [Methanocella sp.]HTY90468.1 V-type ATP synthase subunit E [Methanocella sp.]
MGLDRVVKDISDKAEAESKDIIGKAQVEASTIRKEAEAEAKKAYDTEMARADEAISKMRQRELSSAKLDMKKSKLNAEKDVLGEVRSDLVKRLSAMPKEKKVNILNKLINLARKDVPAGKIYSNAGDAELVKNSGYEYGGNIKCIGGIVVTSMDGSVNLDYTFDSIVDDVWNAQMKPVSDILFGSR